MDITKNYDYKANDKTTVVLNKIILNSIYLTKRERNFNESYHKYAVLLFVACEFIHGEHKAER